METIIFNNEHLWIGNIGKFSVVLSVLASLMAVLFYSMHVNTNNEKYKPLARLFFWIHSIAVVMVFVSLFYIIYKHYYEYQYAYQHSSNELPYYYMISCFWEGQEGSFLLWMFWHVVLGFILLFRAKNWESPVMAVVALAQCILGSMLLGFQFGDVKIGSSPFILLRDYNPESLMLPVLEKLGKANYLQVYKDGNGLNPLLQNYWMVIHPPTLFFGFAATIVPFAYAFAGLWTKQYKTWTVPALPWALVGVMVLGTGIIMGGYWAYESLSFGGYWAWDPVENASLMPWILLIAATHMLLINKVTGKYPILTICLIIFSFFMVLYATFLTRSGILGNSSVHSFTDLGLSGQLILLLFLFIFLTFSLSFVELKKRILFLFSYLFVTLLMVFWPGDSGLFPNILGTLVLISSLVWFIYNLFKIYPVNKEEDNLYSREFWMFVGSLVLLLSGVHIFIFTSIPVFNKLFHLSKAIEGESFYNKWQMVFAVFIVILSAFTQFLKYKNTNSKPFFETVVTTLLISLILSFGSMFLFQLWSIKYLFLLIGSIYAVVANTHYLVKVLKGKIKISGASIAHIGFGLIMIGVLISSVNKRVLSNNNSGNKFYSESTNDGKIDNEGVQKNKENILLVKDKPVLLDKNRLVATFVGVEEKSPNRYFKVKYKSLDKNGKIVDSFTLYPNSQNNPKMGLVSNPDTRHYLTRDIFTHINYESGLDEDDKKDQFDNFKTDTVGIGESFITKDGMRQITLNKVKTLYVSKNNDTIHLQAHLLINLNGDTASAYPEFVYGKTIRIKEDVNLKTGVLSIMDRIYTNNENSQEFKFIITSATKKPKYEYIILKAVEFPYINILWGGTLIMIFGFVLAIIQRFKEAKNRLKIDPNQL